MSYVAILKVNASTKRVEKFQSFSTQAEAEAHVQKFIGTYPLAYCVAEPNGSSTHWLCDTSAKTIVISELVDPDNPAWKRNRQAEYPNHTDCIHALLDGGDTLTDLQAKRTAIKDKYPKE